MINDVMISFDKKTRARCLPKSEGGAWIIIEDDRSPNQVSVFLPTGVPVEKVQTIADAVNDALDTVRVKASEAA